VLALGVLVALVLGIVSMARKNRQVYPA
jgi:hypothetical protein